jgi:ferredoxin-NADP reductase
MAKRRIVDAWMETYNVRTIRFDFRDEPVDFKAGQFVIVADQFRGHPKPIRRAYSIASSPWQRDFVDLTIKRESPGLMSVRLTEVPVGAELEVTNPSGKYFYTAEMGKRVLLIGAGSGITPLYSIARYILDGGLADYEVYLFFSMKTPRDYIYRDEWPKMTAKHRNFHFFPTMTRASAAEWSGRRGRLDAAWIKQEIGEASDCLAYICGPGPMVEASEAVCRELAIPEERIHTEKW